MAFLFNPFTSNFDIDNDKQDLTPYEKLDGSNQPATGNKNVQNTAPELKLTTAGDSNYSRLTRGANDTLNLKNFYTGTVSDYSLRFVSASNQAVQISDVAGLRITGDVTISLWAKFNSYSGGLQNVFGKSDSSDHDSYCLRVLDAGRFDFFCYDGNYTAVVYTGSLATLFGSGWSHIVGRVSGTTWELWVNGVSVASASLPRGNVPATGKVGIGGRMGMNDRFADCYVSRIRLYSRAVTDGEIATLYAGGEPATTNLQLKMNLNEGTGTTPQDISGNLNNGTFYNTPTWVADSPTPFFTPTAAEVTVLSSVGANTTLNGTNISANALSSILLKIASVVYFQLFGDNTDFIALGGTRGAVFRGGAALLSLRNGDLLLSAANSNANSPRTLDAGDWVTGDYFRIRTGDDGFFQAGWGQRGQIFCYHGIEIRGGSATVPPSFVSGGGANDPNLSVINLNATNVGIKLIGTATPSANLQEWYNTTTLLCFISPKGVIQPRTGTATANTAPIKFTSGVLLTSPEAGALEFVTDNLYFTISTGTARKNITLDEGMTSGQVPYVTTNGRLAGQAPVADGTYTVGAALTPGVGNNGTITITNGIITAIQQAT